MENLATARGAPPFDAEQTRRIGRDRAALERFYRAFYDDLLAYFTRRVDSPPRAARVRVVRPRWRVAGLAAAGTLAAALVLGAVGGPWHSRPAFAVTSNPDGTVTFTLHELADPAAATAALRRKGVRAVVLKVAPPGTCAILRVQVPDPGTSEVVEPTDGTRTSVVIAPDRIPAGHTLVLVMDRYGSGVVLMTAVALDPAPMCYAPPVGGPPPTPR